VGLSRWLTQGVGHLIIGEWSPDHGKAAANVRRGATLGGVRSLGAWGVAITTVRQREVTQIGEVNALE